MKTKLIVAIALTSLLSYASYAQDHISGVGLVLKVEDHAVKIMNVLPDTPAARAHLTVGLIVLQIDGTPTDDTHFKKAIDMIRGEAGTKVRLELMDPEKGETNTLELTREKLLLPPHTQGR